MMFMGFFYLAAPPVLVIAGHIARRKLRHRSERSRARSLAAAVLTLGYIGLIFEIGMVTVVFWAFHSMARSAAGASDGFDGKRNVALLTGRVNPREVEGGEVIRFPESDPVAFPIAFYKWEFGFPGFDRAPLSREEAQSILAAFVGAKPQPATPYRPNEPMTETRARMDEARVEVEHVLGAVPRPKAGEGENVDVDVDNASIGVIAPPGAAVNGAVAFHLSGGKSAYVRVLVGPNGAFVYVPAQFHSSMNALYGTVSTPMPALAAAFARAAPGEIPVLDTRLSADEATKRAERRFSSIYPQVVRYVSTTPEVIDAVGPIREIRPAAGPNEESEWMDYGATFTFRVTGEKGAAAVLCEIADNSRTLEMFANGRVTDIPQRFFDWSGGKRE